MSDLLVEQVQKEILRQEGSTTVSLLPPDYDRVASMYAELLRKGVIRKRESLLRSITDPPVALKEALYSRYSSVVDVVKTDSDKHVSLNMLKNR